MRTLSVLFFAGALLTGCAEVSRIADSAGVDTSAGGLEYRTDRNGADFDSFAMNGAGPEACRAACQENPRCRAFTWTEPGYQHRTGMCWLKDAVPARSELAEAVSGVVRR
jgi:hypothetical protein